jgi:hypothetical protein
MSGKKSKLIVADMNHPLNNTAARLIEIAEAEIGYSETFDNLTKYGEAMKANGLPWCGSFVNFCAKKAKVKIPNTVSTVNGSNAFKKLERWEKGSINPLPGWIAYFDFPSDNVNRISHVGIVVKDLGGGWCETIEGNTSGSGSQRNGGEVMRKKRQYGSGGSIVGFGRPDFKESA